MQSREQQLSEGGHSRISLVASFIVAALSFVSSIVTIASASGEPYVRQLLVISTVSAAVALVVGYATFRTFAAFERRRMRRRERSWHTLIESNTRMGRELAHSVHDQEPNRGYAGLTHQLTVFKHVMEVRTQSRVGVVLKAVGQGEDDSAKIYFLTRALGSKSAEELTRIENADLSPEATKLLAGADYFLSDAPAPTYPNNQKWPSRWNSLLAVPIRQNGKLLGFMSLDSTKHRAFSRDDIELAQLMSRQLLEHLLMLGSFVWVGGGGGEIA